MLERFQTFVNSGVPVTPEIQKLTGITPEMVRGGVTPQQALVAFKRFSAGAPLVAHNAGFDIGVLAAEAQRAGVAFPRTLSLDTLQLSRRAFQNVPNHKLGTLAKQFGLSPSSHRALADAETTAQLFGRIQQELGGGTRKLLSNKDRLTRILDTRALPGALSAAQEDAIYASFQSRYATKRIASGLGNISAAARRFLGTRQGKYALGGAAVLTAGYFAFSGKDDSYNTIEGMSHLGLAAQQRRILTDFGSGYQGQDDNSNALSYALLGGGAAGAGTYFAARAPSLYNKHRYKRLHKLQQRARAGGFKIWDPAAALGAKELTLNEKLKHPDILFRTLQNNVGDVADLQGFSGLLYVASNRNLDELKRAVRGGKTLNPEAMVTSLFTDRIGGDKLSTYNYLVSKGIQQEQPLTVGANLFVGKRARFSLGDLIKEVGGTKNLVLKDKLGALSEGVWTDFSKVPENVLADLHENPNNYLFQKKLDLADEFRVVTVGDKPIYSAYRWGSHGSKRAIDFIRGLSPRAADYIEKNHYGENVVPVFDKKLQRRLERFSERIAKKLPYEIGAFDIGLTKQGELKLIEAQRYFGTLRNPLVIHRMEKLLGKGGISPVAKLAVGAAVGVGIAGGLVANAFSGHDDSYNTIEGLRHGGLADELRKRNTEFGSGWDKVRALAKQAGQSYESFLDSDVFQKALSEASVIKELGLDNPSVFGRAHLMRTTVQGEELLFIRKTPRETMPEFARREATFFKGEAENQQQFKNARAFDFKREGGMLRKYQEGIVPSAYRVTDDELIMELMPGKPIADLADEGLDIPEAAWKEYRKQAMKVASGMDFNPDIHAGNLMYDPQTGRASWIDFGLAFPNAQVENMTAARSLAQMQNDISLHKTGVAKAAERAREKLEQDRIWAELDADVPAPQPSAVQFGVKRNLKGSSSLPMAVPPPPPSPKPPTPPPPKNPFPKFTSDLDEGLPPPPPVQLPAKQRTSAIMRQLQLEADQRRLADAAVNGGKSHVKRRSEMPSVPLRRKKTSGG